MKKLETECQPYADMVFGTIKIEEDLPGKEELDLWLERAGNINIHHSVYPLFSYRGDILNSSKVWLDESHIEGLDTIWTYFAIQEIYARHGKKFTEPFLHWYFGMQDWYRPWEYDFEEEKLNKMEKDNIELLMEHAGFLNDSNFRDAYSKYINIPNHDSMSDEMAECIIKGIDIALKQIMEIDYSYPDEQEEPLGGFVLKEHLNHDEMETFLLDYVDKKSIRKSSCYIIIFSILLCACQSAGIKQLESEDFSVYSEKNTIELGSLFEDFIENSTEKEEGNDYVGEIYKEDQPYYKVYVHYFADFDIYISNINYDVENRDFDTYIIQQITLKTSVYKTNRDRSIGSGLNDVMNVYGEGIESVENKTRTLVYSLGDKSISFMFNEHDMVDSITLIRNNN